MRAPERAENLSDAATLPDRSPNLPTDLLLSPLPSPFLMLSIPSAATRVRSELDKEAAKLLLGHISTDTTEIYLLDEVKETMKVAKQLDASKQPKTRKKSRKRKKKAGPPLKEN